MKIPKIYLVKSGTESHRTITNMVRKIADARQARIDFVLREIPSFKESGPPRIGWATGKHWGIHVLSFGNTIYPRGWVTARGTSVLMPTTKTKHGRALRAEMLRDTYTVPNQFDFPVALGIIDKQTVGCQFNFEEITNRDFVVFLNYERDGKIVIPRDFSRISDIEYENLKKRIRKNSNKLSLNKILYGT